MSSRVRSLGLRVAFLLAVVASMFAVHVTVLKPNLPFALFDSFDRAFALVSEAADKQLDKVRTPAVTVAQLLDKLDGEITVACDAATDLLDTELVLSDMLDDARRASVRGCIERLMRDTRDDLAYARDPDLRAEYQATLERLREVRELI